MVALEFQKQFAHLMRFAVARWSPVSDSFLEIMACATSGRSWPTAEARSVSVFDPWSPVTTGRFWAFHSSHSARSGVSIGIQNEEQPRVRDAADECDNDGEYQQVKTASMTSEQGGTARQH